MTDIQERESYNPAAIEKKWQQRWESDQLYRSKVDWNKPKHYALTMLPYPSGDLHIGHWFAMTPSDTRARFKRMQGYNVLFPMGFDAFGLPAENAAVQRNIQPAKWTYANIERMRKQLRTMGTMFDWKREAVSCDPKYYKWTEWFFKIFYQNDLAYRSEALVNWSPTLQTVLANEQVIDGKDERTGQPVVQKLMTQWFFRYTRYTDELLNFDKIDWPEPIRTMQENWIGRSEGARVKFKIDLTTVGAQYGAPLQSASSTPRPEGEGAGVRVSPEIEVYTTRPDTLWGATFMVLAPEHPLVEMLTTAEQVEAVAAYKAAVSRKTELERITDDKEKTGVFTGGYAVNPVNGARIPVWIADYVLITYGTGAIMAVPSGDQRDFEFARKYGLEIIPVVQPDDAEPLDSATMTEAWTGSGTMINSGSLNGLRCNGEKGRKNPSISAAIDHIQKLGVGREAVNYRLRDWLISRQRYWGSPIPIIHKADGTMELVADEQLPVMLPDEVDFMPTGRSPLTYHEPFLNTVDSEGKPAKRETDTMDTFMCSSWYHLRYLSPDYDKAPFDPEEAAYWLPVDTYTGGAEHATMHLLYTRWFNKALRDLGVFDNAAAIAAQHGRNAEAMFDEPMLQLRNQGQILGEERDGDVIMASGRYEGDKLFADVVEVIERGTEDAARAANPTAVIGEITKRTERVLTVEMDGKLRTVEVIEGASVIIPAIPGENSVNQLKQHLDIQRMSKSKGNVVNPDELVAQYGADAVRAYMMFGFDWTKGGPWNSQQIQGVVRWLNDVWEICTAAPPTGAGDAAGEREMERCLHVAIAKVTEGLETFSFNTTIAALMTLRNDLKAALRDDKLSEAGWRETLRGMLLLMAPFTPHIAEELWARLGFGYSVHQQLFPVYDADKARSETTQLVIMKNGKPVGHIDVPAEIGEADAQAAALASEIARRFLNGGAPKKVVYVPGRNGMEPKVNIVV
jgi:leucyl-tRNA synthetase